MFKSKKKVLLIGFGLLLVAGAVYFWWPRPGINASNFARIRLGMTEAEVEELLGEPGEPRMRSVKCWLGDNLVVLVELDADSKVVWKSSTVSNFESGFERMWHLVSRKKKTQGEICRQCEREHVTILVELLLRRTGLELKNDPRQAEALLREMLDDVRESRDLEDEMRAVLTKRIEKRLEELQAGEAR